LLTNIGNLDKKLEKGIWVRAGTFEEARAESREVFIGSSYVPLS